MGHGSNALCVVLLSLFLSRSGPGSHFGFRIPRSDPDSPGHIVAVCRQANDEAKGGDEDDPGQRAHCLGHHAVLVDEAAAMRAVVVGKGLALQLRALDPIPRASVNP